MSQRGFFGHPSGLGYIAFTEAWERFSFYGMQALLVLYMAGHLFQPEHAGTVWGLAAYRGALETLVGPLTTQAFATQTFGLYIGLVYLTPVLGGLAGDRWFGRFRAVLAGALVMAAGHFLMAIEAAFLPALVLLILGCGLLKGNLAAQVGDLYARDDPRRDSAFSIYVLSINLGAAVAPLVCGTLGEMVGWHYGFAAAGIGMLVGTAIYLAGRRTLPPDRISVRHAAARLQHGDGRIVAALLGMLAITCLFWTAQTQVWNSYPLWLKDRVDRAAFGTSVPVTWFQSLDTAAVLALAPLILLLWKRQNRRGVEPGDLTKIAIGFGVFGLACTSLSLGEWLAGAGGHVALLWPVLFHFCCAAGYLYAAPTALALVSRGAPASVNAMMVGTYYAALFVGGIISGRLGALYEVWPPASFWLLHGAIVAAGAILMLAVRGPLLRTLRLSAPSTPGATSAIDTEA